MPNSRTPRLIGRIVKITATLLIFSVCGVLLWRIFSSGDPDSVSVLRVNERTYAAYDVYGEDMLLQYQNQSTITRGENNAGYFSVTQYVFIPQADQVQLVFRYNNSTIRNLASDYELEAVPDKSETLFDVTLVLTEDLTPEDRSDNTDRSKLKETRCFATVADTFRDETSLYTYYRFVFDNVHVDELTVGVFADIYYVGDIDYDREPYGALCLYDDESEWIRKKLTDRDVAALKQFSVGQ